MLRLTRKYLVAASACAAATVAVEPVAAQPASSPYDPVGFRSGPIYFLPSVSVEGVYNDNVYAEEGTKRGDELLVIRPQLEIQTDWSRHALQLHAGGEFGMYESFTDEDYRDYEVGGKLMLDVTGATRLLFEADHSRSHQTRGDSEEVEGLELTKFDVTNAKVQLERSLGRVSLSGGGSFRRYDFNDVAAVGGGFINNDDRDHDIITADAKAAFEFSPGYRVYTELAYNWRDFNETVDDVGVNRDSKGFQLDAGVEFELTNLLVGSIYAGYMRQKIEDPSLRATKGLSFGASLDWSVSTLTTVSLEGQRTVEDSQFVNTAGFFADRGRLNVEHRFRDNLTVSVYGEIGQDRYRDVGRSNLRYGFGATAEWKINRFLAVDVAYSYLGRDSSFTIFDDFNQNRFTVGLKAHC